MRWAFRRQRLGSTSPVSTNRDRNCYPAYPNPYQCRCSSSPQGARLGISIQPMRIFGAYGLPARRIEPKLPHTQNNSGSSHALEKRVKFPDLDLPEIEEGTSPVYAAQLLRQHWRVQRGPVPHLAATMESRGLVICLIPLTNESVSRVKAYSTRTLGRPLVIVTPERFKSVYEYRFTCAHEIGHLLMHPSPLPGDRQQEREADQFAAEFLTPRTEIEPLLPRTARIASLEQLSGTWGVSVESLIYRMGNFS